MSIKEPPRVMRSDARPAPPTLSDGANVPSDEEEPPSRPGVSVEVSNTQTHLRVDEEFLGRVVRNVLEAEGVAAAALSIALVDDPTIREINRRHLDHDFATDVISFGLSDPGEPELSGELVVSAETAVRTALAAGVAPLDELTLYVVHGLLHLCGHDDTTDDARSAMRRREGEVLAVLGVTNPFPAVEPGDEDASTGATEATP